MKIAFISQPTDRITAARDESSSVAIINHQLAWQLARDHEVLICAARFRGQPLRETDAAGVRIERIAAGSRKVQEALQRIGDILEVGRPHFASPLHFRGYFARAARALSRERPDVVHFHGQPQHAPLLRAHLPDSSIVLHMHGYSLEQLERDSLIPALRCIDLVIGVSDSVTNPIRARFPELADRCHTVYNGFDPERFRPHEGKGAFPDPERAPGRDRRVLYVGRLSPEKGIHVLLDAFEILAPRRPDCQLDLVGSPGLLPYGFVVGPSADPLVASLARFYGRNPLDRFRRQLLHARSGYVSELQAGLAPELARRVHQRTALPGSSLPDVYGAADVFVCPSVCEEPGSIPVLEAMACGLPTVASRGGGVSEAIEDGRSGLLVDRGDPVALAAALERVLEDAALAGSLGAAAARRSALFTWDRAVRQLDALYEGATGGGLR